MSNQVFEKIHAVSWRNHFIVTTEYIILAKNQHPIFVFHNFKAKLLGKYSQTPCDSCQIRDLINFQNNLTRPKSSTTGINLEYRLKYS